MTSKTTPSYTELETTGRMNRTMYRLTNYLGLTTGVGVIGWGIWCLIATLVTFVYEESGLPLEEIVIENALNEGLLLSAVVIALGVIVLELKKLQEIIARGRAPRDDEQAD